MRRFMGLFMGVMLLVTNLPAGASAVQGALPDASAKGQQLASLRAEWSALGAPISVENVRPYAESARLPAQGALGAAGLPKDTRSTMQVESTESRLQSGILGRPEPGVSRMPAVSAIVSEPRTGMVGESLHFGVGVSARNASAAANRSRRISTTSATRIVTSASNSGAGTLRQALLDAQAGDIITFSPTVFPPGSPATIRLSSSLPAPSAGNITIDATAAGVIIDGNGVAEVGLDITSDDNTVQGLRIRNLRGNGVRITGDYNQVIGSMIESNGQNGILISGTASYNNVGGSTPAERNVISGNGAAGVAIDGAGTYQNTVSGNYIGTNATGSVAVPNREGVVLRNGTQANLIGEDLGLSGSRAVTCTGRCNLISGNVGAGVVLSGTGTFMNDVLGNFVGVDVQGTRSLGNGVGILVAGGAASNLVGSWPPGQANIVSGNLRQGVEVRGVGTASNHIVSNLVGTDPGGTLAVPNLGDGVLIADGAPRNGVTDNTLSGNQGSGIRVEGAGTDSNTIDDNRIGTNEAGGAALGNGQAGVLVTGGARLTHVEDNVVSGNRGSAGLVITASGTMSTAVGGNLIGTDATGARAVPNTGAGVQIGGGTRDNRVGIGSFYNYRNTVSGNLARD